MDIKQRFTKASPSSGDKPASVWSLNSVAWLFLLCYGVAPFLTGYLLKTRFPAMEEAQRFVWVQAVVPLAWAGTFGWLCRRYGLTTLRQVCGLTWTRPTAYYLQQGGMAILVTLALGVALSALITGLGQNPDHPYAGLSPQKMEVVGFLALTTAPLLEEIVFRGLLQGTLRLNHPAWMSIGITAITFTLFHVNYSHHLWAAGYVLSLGLVLGIFRERTGSILPGMAAHVVNNVLALAGLF